MKVETFKGKPILVLSPDSPEEFRLGIRKAKCVLAPDNLTQLRRFVGEYDRPKAEPKEEKPAAPTVDLAKELESLRAQVASLTKAPTEQPDAKKDEKPAGRFAAK